MWAYPVQGFQAARALRGTEDLAPSLKSPSSEMRRAHLLQSSTALKGDKGVRLGDKSLGAGTQWTSSNPVSPWLWASLLISLASSSLCVR